MHRRLALSAAAALGAVAALVPTASAAPAPVVVSKTMATCTIGKVAGLRSFTKVRIHGTQLAASFLDATGCSAAYDIVVKAAVQQTPFALDGFQCTPRIVSKRVGQWTCVMQAADSAAVIRQTFTARYAK